MPASQASLGYGAYVEISTGDSPDVMTTMDEVYTITPPNFTFDTVDVSHMQSPGRKREYISGMGDGGDFSFEMNYVPGSTADDFLFALQTLSPSVDHKRWIKVTVPPLGVSDLFRGELTGYEKSITFDDKMTATVTFKVSGELTRGST